MPQVAGSNTKYLVTAGWDDAAHLGEQEKADLLASTPSYLRDARSMGIPALGSGRIFIVPEESIRIDAFPIPKHWPRLVGMDFGWDHPAAFTWLAWDRDTDTVYAYDVHRVSETLIPMQSMAVMSRGKWIPVAWPHDGYQVRDAMHGEQLAAQYRTNGVNMRPEHAQFESSQMVGERKESRISTEAGIQEMNTRLTTGKMRVFSHLTEWFEEYRMYHREKGLIVKERDDLMSATRIGIMDLRFAIVEPSNNEGPYNANEKPDWF